MTYGEQIRKIRERKGIKAKYVAGKLGLSASQYCDLEKGRKKLDAHLTVKIAGILEVTPNDILCPGISVTLTMPTGTDGQ